MDSFRQDVRYAWRLWRRSPGFTAVAVLTLALGIGANTAMFSVIRATVLQPLPFPEPERLVSVWRGAADDPRSLSIMSLPNFRDLRERSRTLERLALFDSAGRGYSLTGEGEPEQVLGLRVTASFFEVLGIRPRLGRTFLVDEETAGRDRVVVLSHGLWTRRYAADTGIVGRTIQIDGQAHEVVGVMPPDFQFQFWSGARQLWVPAGWTRGDADRSSNSFVALARLRPEATLDQAQNELDLIGRALAREHPEHLAGRTMRVVPVQDYGVEGLRPILLVLLGVVAFVLLIACVNVANLLLARAATRSRELAVRCALGAGRGRVVRQLLTESVLLALAGGGAGVLLAVVGTRLLVPVLPGALTRLPLRPVEHLPMDVPVLAVTCAVAIVAGVLFGLAPALTAFRADMAEPMKDAARGLTGGRSRWVRQALVAAEVALTLVVLAAAGMLIVSMARLLRVDAGFDPRNVLLLSMALPQENLYYGPPGNVRFCDALDRQVGALPGVVSVSGIAHAPLGGGNAGRGLAVEGRPDQGPGNQPGANYSVACPNLLRTLGIPLVAGRDFTHDDTVEAPGVVLVNETFARRFWPKEDAIAKRFKIGSPATDAPWLMVVGVFRDVRHNGLDQPASAHFYRPYSQAGWPNFTIVVKTVGATGALVEPIKRAIGQIEPARAIGGVRTYEEVVGLSTASRRFPMLLLTGFGILALAMAVVGIASVVSYAVVQRTAEIGVRMALGATPRDVLRLVVGDNIAWAVGGLAAGLGASLLLLRLLDTLMFGISATDPRVLGAAAGVLLVAAVMASYVPARRAMQVDPVQALR